MSTAHTPAPWRLETDTGPCVFGSAERQLGECYEDGQEQTPTDLANARRIVACVNYCEGVSTAEIEAAPKSMNLRAILDAFDSVVAKAVS